jgi:hypothetical protein
VVLCIVVLAELAIGQPMEFGLLTIICYVLFTLPSLRFGCLRAALYQRRRWAVAPAEGGPPPAREPRQRRDLALTEAEVVAAARATRQPNTKSFAPIAAPKVAPKAAAGKPARAVRTFEDNTGGVISELRRGGQGLGRGGKL